jgi:hypothetical protein
MSVSSIRHRSARPTARVDSPNPRQLARVKEYVTRRMKAEDLHSNGGPFGKPLARVDQGAALQGSLAKVPASVAQAFKAEVSRAMGSATDVIAFKLPASVAGGTAKGDFFAVVSLDDDGPAYGETLKLFSATGQAVGTANRAGDSTIKWG